ncbi:MAG TPA: carboxypeptidase-like regulatory domain-containing protein [Thermoanaerobaculia bacterium]|nr:carboxypeptidase-like regulatory domain-containing protein [Thermoanaerobaculia bacterium]
MRRFRALAIAAAIFAIAAPVQPNTPAPASPLQVLGTVTNAARPVANALVIALNLHDFDATQTYTTLDGSFELPDLRAGIYKIIAVKQGFLPTIATLVPTGAKHRVALKLENEKRRKSTANQEMWELRGSLPPDVLREVDQLLQPVEIASYEIPRFRGEMLSLTGVSNQTANPAFAQTALGVQGRIGETWQVGIRGNMQRFEDPTDEVRFGPPLAETSGMSMEIRSSATDAYRVASTKSSWVYAEEDAGQADVRAHNFEWQHGATRVQVRYFEQENLFRELAAGSNLIEIAGNVPVFQTRRTDLGVAVRVTQETVDSNTEILRTADVAANGTIELVPSLILHYGMASRIGVTGQEWAPRTGAEWKITENTSVVGSALVKVLDHNANTFSLPALVFFSEDARVLPKYTYTFGIVSGKDAKNRLSAMATMTAADAPLRVVFADAYDQFWDGLYVESGDVRRDVRIAYRREFGNRFAIDVAGTAGTATQRDLLMNERQKIYIVGDLQSTFTPTRTTLAVSYREIQQPREKGEEDYRTERINVRMAQSLYLPIDIKLLLGMELARAENSPYLIDTLTPEGTSKKYIGGLALNF